MEDLRQEYGNDLQRVTQLKKGVQQVEDEFEDESIPLRKIQGLLQKVREITVSPDWRTFDSLLFTYSSATRITIANGVPSDYFATGDKIEIIQTTTKYFYVTAVGSTYIDVYAGNDYTVANASITSLRASRFDKPTGFPSEFSWSPTFGTFGGVGFAVTIANGDRSAKFSMKGNLVKIRFWAINITATGTTGSVVTMTPPITAASSSSSFNYRIPMADSAASVAGTGWVGFQSTSNMWLTFHANLDVSANNSCSFEMTYEI